MFLLAREYLGWESFALMAVSDEPFDARQLVPTTQPASPVPG